MNKKIKVPKCQDVPSPDDFWTMIQRYFSLEEPSSRWSKQRKSLLKLLKRVESSNPDLDSMTLEMRSRIISQFFGFGNSDTLDSVVQLSELSGRKKSCANITGSINRAISVLFALEDLRRFQKLAFDLWMKDDTLSHSAATPFAYSLRDTLPISDSESAWLISAELSQICWTRLLNEGPWIGDSRWLFLTAVMESIATSENPENILVCQSIWNETLKKFREAQSIPGDFLPKVIVLAEGQSEEILLPRFAELKGTDFASHAVEVKSCGGAKQVVRQFLNLRDVVELPMVAILDSDVNEEAEILKESLREIDSLLVLKEGELEDSYSDETFVKLINYYIAETGSATFLPLEKLNLNKGRVEQVSRFWRRNNLGEFDKLEFARLSSKRLQSEDVPREFTRIIGSIKEAAHGKEALRFS